MSVPYCDTTSLQQWPRGEKSKHPIGAMGWRSMLDQCVRPAQARLESKMRQQRIPSGRWDGVRGYISAHSLRKRDSIAKCISKASQWGDGSVQLPVERTRPWNIRCPWMHRSRAWLVSRIPSGRWGGWKGRTHGNGPVVVDSRRLKGHLPIVDQDTTSLPA